jgi:hypothetical protein
MYFSIATWLTLGMEPLNVLLRVGLLGAHRLSMRAAHSTALDTN